MSSEAWKTDTANDDVQMPLGVGGDPGAAEEFSGKARARPNGSTLALIAAFVAALVSLYVLGLQNKPRMASAEELAHSKELEVRWEKALAAISDKTKGVPKTISETRGLVEMLTRYFEGRADDAELPSNPFERVVAHVATPTTPDMAVPLPKVGATPEEIQAAEDLRSAAQEFAGLRLQMIMLGKPSSALINNKVVQPGFKFKYLEVDEITSDAVILKHNDKRFELSARPK